MKCVKLNLFSIDKPDRLAFKYMSGRKLLPKIMNNSITNRGCCSFLYIEQGDYVYSWGKNTFDVHGGDIVFLPEGGSYSYQILSSGAITYQTEFLIYDLFDGQHYSAEHPMLIYPDDKFEIISQFKKLADFNNSFCEYFMGQSLLYKIFGNLYSENQWVDNIGLGEAIKFIHKNYTKNICGQQLCEISNYSESQIRRLFHKKFGMSPIKYCNELRYKTAREMLISGGYSISEIALSLGFESLYSFSTFFKKKAGMSPSAFKQNQRKKI